MTILELAAACVDAINHPERGCGECLITLVWMKGRNPLPRKGWPRPKHLLCENPRGEKVWLYDAKNLLAAMVAHGLVELKTPDIIGVSSTAVGAAPHEPE